jgi:tRNA modification GTPase
MRDTIAAIATPPGRGGIGIIRISGSQTQEIAHKILGFVPQVRQAEYADFRDQNGEIIDQGLAIYFQNPQSFTGEDVLELQGHGGPVILDCLLKNVLQCGARLARPGEFSERAFLNDKIDLTQAEAIADLIDAQSTQAARAAVRSLQGEFSKKIAELVHELIQLRMYVEAAIDFPEEEIDFLSDKKITDQLQNLLRDLQTLQKTAQQGALLREGMRVVITGKPNAGKSSLLNALNGQDVAIVTEIPGTTRDVLRSEIQIDGLPLHVIDTAGLRESSDPVELEGIRRAKAEIEKADRILLLLDSAPLSRSVLFASGRGVGGEGLWSGINFNKVTIIINKIDLQNKSPHMETTNDIPTIFLSAKTGQGVDLLREHLKSCMGFESNPEGNIIARRRHLDAIARAEQAVTHGFNQLVQHRAGELLAEDLRQAQQALNEITGEFTADDLLGKIFSSFCIGK